MKTLDNNNLLLAFDILAARERREKRKRKREAKLRLPSKQKLYIITTEDHWPVKIGVSENPQIRLSSLQVGYWKALKIFRTFDCGDIPAIVIEQLLFEEFKQHRLQGEWFGLEAERALDMILISLNWDIQSEGAR